MPLRLSSLSLAAAPALLSLASSLALVLNPSRIAGWGSQLSNEEEILGLYYQFQRTGARAVIAALWQVDDGGTQALLMNAFYEILLGKITKAEALRQAQIALVQSNSKATQQRGSLVVKDIGQLPPKELIASITLATRHRLF